MSGPETTRARTGLGAARKQLALAGLDLVEWFSIEGANRRLAPEHRLPRLDGVGAVIGNTRALWGPFLQWYNEHPETPDALDHYVENAVRTALTELPVAWLRFSHELSPSPIPIQRYAAVSGLAQMGPAGLSIHANYGPWIALRAVALFDQIEEGLPPAKVRPHPCDTCARPCLEPFEEAMRAERRTARRFLPVRMSCPVGSEFRYDQEQLDYHYG